MTVVGSEVYDLIYPSPTTLKKISSIAVTFEVWREENAKLGRSDPSFRFLTPDDIDLKKAVPDVPSVIYDLLEEQVNNFRWSLSDWLSSHRDKIFDPGSESDVLKRFHDFVFDWNGAIHYVRTARKMLRCEVLSEEEKFKIACEYCFENDIRRIWPSVSGKMDLDDFNFNKFPFLFYWICRLKNQQHRIRHRRNESVDEIMLSRCKIYEWSSLEYFWNRIPLEKQLQTAKQRFKKFDAFCLFLRRFILNKFNQRQLDEFITETVSKLVECLSYEAGSYNPTERGAILSSWLFLRNKINQSDFNAFIQELLEQTTNDAFNKEPNLLRPTDKTYIGCEIWKTAPYDLRRSAIKSVLNNGEWIHDLVYQAKRTREMRLIFTILLDASVEERSEFFRRNWTRLITGARFKDFDGLIKLCLKDENAIVEFKRNDLGKFENINYYCGVSMSLGYIAELNDFLAYCQPDIKMRRELMQRLVRHKFFGEKSYCLVSILRKSGKINSLSEFIDNSFDSVDLATDLKNEFLSAPATENCLFESVERSRFIDIMEFANIFVPAQAHVDLKKRLFNYFKDHLITGTIKFDLENPDELQKFLIWCLGDEDEVDKFKRSVSADDIFWNMVRFRKYEEDRETLVTESPCNHDPIRYRRQLDAFLQWYFSTNPEEIENFKERFPNEWNFYT